MTTVTNPAFPVVSRLNGRGPTCQMMWHLPSRYPSSVSD